MLRRVSALPDPSDLRAIADRISGHAAAARERAWRLEQAIAAVDWEGFAADAFYGQARAAADGLRRAAGRIDTAADALRRHADRIGVLISGAVRLSLDGVELVKDGLLHPNEVPGDVADVFRDGAGLVGSFIGSFL
jgi:hypothetical protein